MLLVVSKLTKTLKRRWGLHAIDQPKTDLKQLDAWLQHQTRAAVMTDEYNDASTNDDTKQKSKGKGDKGSSARVGTSTVRKGDSGGSRNENQPNEKKDRPCFV